MGIYINPTTGDQAQWLRLHASLCSGGVPTVAEVRLEGRELLWWVDNVAFTALGWAFSEMERGAFLLELARPFMWFTCRQEDLWKDTGLSEALVKLAIKEGEEGCGEY